MFFYHTKGLSSNFFICTVQKIPEGISIRLENHFFPKWKQQNPLLLNQKPPKKQKVEKKNRFFFSKHFSGKWHSAENSEEGTLRDF